jgi:prophage antirepressor-like protein
MSSAVLISESGLYKLILRSDKPQAKPFQDWVTQVVLPAIRKDGAAAGRERR